MQFTHPGTWLGAEGAAVEVDQEPGWMLASSARRAREAGLERSVRLLGGFDQYVIAASPQAAHLMTCESRSRTYRPQGWVSPVLLVNGLMDGAWRYEIKGSIVEVTSSRLARCRRGNQRRTLEA